MFDEEQSGAWKARTPAMTCEWEEVAWLGFACWFHHRCSRWVMDMSHKSNFLKASRLPKFWTHSFLQAHRDTSEESGVVQGQFLSVLKSPPSSLSNKAIPWHILSFSILREKKNILHNSRLKPSINSHTDYKSHRGKIHRIVSKSKNRSRLGVSMLVTEHTGISILKGNETKKNVFWINFEWMTNPGKPHSNPWQVKKKKRETLQSLRVSCPKGKPRGTWSCDCAASLTPGSRGCAGIPHSFGQTK